MAGEMPATGLDHKDLDGTNNKWGNIRLANQSQNGANRGRIQRPTKSGIKGVVMSRNNQWAAGIWKDRKRYHLGTFKTPQEAGFAYAKAAYKIYGEFARVA